MVQDGATRVAKEPPAWRELWDLGELPYKEGGGPPGAWSEVPITPIDRLWGVRARAVAVEHWQWGFRRAPDGRVRLGLWPQAAADSRRAAMAWQTALQAVGVPAPVLVALDEPALAHQVLAGLKALGAESAAVAPAAVDALRVAWEGLRPRTLITAPYRALCLAEGADGMPDLLQTPGTVERLVLTGGMSGGQALRNRLGGLSAAVREVLAPTGVWAPVAVECAAGRWHWAEDPPATGMAVEWVPLAESLWDGEADLVRVVLTTWPPQGAVPLLRVDSGALVRTGNNTAACPCGQAGTATPVGWWPQAQAPRLNGRLLPPDVLLQAVLGEAEVGPTFEAVTGFDRGRGRDLITLTVPVADPERSAAVRERIRERLWEATGTGVRVLPATAAPETAPDFRLRATAR
jgi:hypothetical protein